MPCESVVIPDSSGDFELTRAEGRYATLTGRKLGKDYRQLLSGQAFAEQIGALRSDASESERRHFLCGSGIIDALSVYASHVGHHDASGRGRSLGGLSFHECEGRLHSRCF